MQNFYTHLFFCFESQGVSFAQCFKHRIGTQKLYHYKQIKNIRLHSICKFIKFVFGKLKPKSINFTIILFKKIKVKEWLHFQQNLELLKSTLFSFTLKILKVYQMVKFSYIFIRFLIKECLLCVNDN